MPITDDGKVTFFVDLQHNGREYQGGFTVRKPNFGDVGAISAGISRLAQGQPIADNQTGAILNAIANLSVLVESFPSWWDDVMEQEDIPMVMAVYAHYLRERNESPFRQAKSRGEASDSSGGATGSSGASGDTGASPGDGTGESGQ